MKVEVRVRTSKKIKNPGNHTVCEIEELYNGMRAVCIKDKGYYTRIIFDKSGKYIIDHQVVRKAS
jgi:hypothetical protein